MPRSLSSSALKPSHFLRPPPQPLPSFILSSSSFLTLLLMHKPQTILPLASSFHSIFHKKCLRPISPTRLTFLPVSSQAHPSLPSQIGLRNQLQVEWLPCRHRATPIQTPWISRTLTSSGSPTRWWRPTTRASCAMCCLLEPWRRRLPGQVSGWGWGGELVTMLVFICRCSLRYSKIDFLIFFLFLSFRMFNVLFI